MTKVKICGITNLEDALASLFSGAEAIGFVFYKKSPRYISPLKARNISRILGKRISKTGVFVNSPAAQVRRIARMCGLDMLQFHGDESPEYCRSFKKYKVIKALKAGCASGLENAGGYKGCFLLFDSCVNGRFGGTGKKFSWNSLVKAGKIKDPFFLSGGLTPGNVRRAITLLRPAWVDVSTGVEAGAGKKDHRKIRKFMDAVCKRTNK
ncbi:MAG: phosphoribosylanthranilate isomerase [Candidatus Omnitrophica bacterium]|jgi:phosphoribosylanthranilate isomerase|nr:phosphoribosylanthranilate isomerase [Candidatus Omnitrophota bacterium]MDD5500291.1 phosphoribosylanthranilate isomerase [Candidatus Omnitrophota bacterium]